MSSTYSTNLAIELIGTGDQAGSWGNTTNTNLGTLIEQAISGYVTQAVSTGTDTTITIPNGATGVARNMYIELTGTGGTNTNLIVPANKKLYFIFNNSTGDVTVKVSGQTGVSVLQGKKVVLTSNGTDVVNGLNYIADFGSNSATITQLTATSATITNLTLTSLVISNLSIASANITTLTSGSATITNLINSGGTANGVLYLNGSKVATSGSALTFDGTNLGIGTASPSSFAKLAVLQTSGSNVLQIATTTNAAGIYWVLNNAGVQYQLCYGGTYSVGTSDANVLAFQTNSSERMRIDSSGNVGIGTSTTSNALVTANGNIKLGGSISTGILGLGDTNVTSSYVGIYRGTAAGTSSGNWLNVGGYDGIAFTVGTSAFGSQTERMRIDSSGNVGIGGTADAGRNLHIRKNITGATVATGATVEATVQSDVTVAGIGYSTSLSTQATSFTAGLLYHYYASQGTIGSGSTVTTQAGFFAENSLTGATNNYGFYSNIASGSNRWNFYAAGTAQNYFAGLTSVGTTVAGGFNGTFVLGGSGSPTSGFLEGIHSNQLVPSSVTTRYDAFLSSPGTASASFTVGSIRHYAAQQGTFNSPSAVTSQYGFFADNTLTGATNNFGFYSDIASGSNRWNFYAAGTARNYFAGGVEDAAGNLRAIPRTGSAKTSTYTLTVSDVGQFVELGTSGGIDVPNGVFSTGDVVSVFNNTSGNTTISLTITTAYIGGTNADKASVTLATRGVATVLFISNSVCVLTGNVS